MTQPSEADTRDIQFDVLSPEEALIETTTNLRRFPVWVLYDQSADPQNNNFIARMVMTLPEQEYTNRILVNDDLEKFQQFMARNFVLLPRPAKENKNVVGSYVHPETWYEIKDSYKSDRT